jgi:hypothetical protein
MACGISRPQRTPCTRHFQWSSPRTARGQLYENPTVPQKKLVMVPDMDHDLDGLSIYRGLGLDKPLPPHASRVMDEIVAWIRADHA